MCGSILLLSFIEAVLYLCGVSDVESLEQETVEHYARMAEHPVEINFCSHSELIATGLFSAYQAAVLCEYRSETGSVLSLTELSLLDGFGEAFVEALSLFISLSPNSVSDGKTSGSGNQSRGRESLTSGSGSLTSGSGNQSRGRESRSRGSGRGENSDSGGNMCTADRAGGKSKRAWRKSKNVRASLVSRVSLKYPTISAGLRCDVDVGGRALLWLGSSGFSGMESFTAGLNYIGKRRRTSLVIGDFNARFGQGTGLWNTMTMSSLSSVSSLIKRPSGFSVSTSFASNYALTGAAFSAELGKHSIYAAVAVPGVKQYLISVVNKTKSRQSLSLMPILGYNCWTRHASFGLTAVPSFRKNYLSLMVSADARACVSSVDIAAEFTYMFTVESVKSVAANKFYAVTAVSAPLGESFKGGVRAYFSPTVHSATSSVEYSDRSRTHSAVLSIEPSYRLGKGIQTKILSSYKYKWCTSPATLGLEKSFVSVRGTFRHQTYSSPAVRASLRVDCSIGYCGMFATALRTEALYCGGAAMLAYVEQSFRLFTEGHRGPLKICLRTGIFFADDWNRRIYVYERDAPGCFNVPAFYGRGMCASSYLSWRFSRWGKLAFRFAYTSYPFTQPQIKKKPDRLESRIQASFSF